MCTSGEVLKKTGSRSGNDPNKTKTNKAAFEVIVFMDHRLVRFLPKVEVKPKKFPISPFQRARASVHSY